MLSVKYEITDEQLIELKANEMAPEMERAEK